MDAPNGPSRALEQGLKCPAPNRVIHHSFSSGPLRRSPAPPETDSGNTVLERSHRKSAVRIARSEENTSELQSLMRISYAVFCLTKKTTFTRANANEPV